MRRLARERWLICGQSLGAALTLRYSLDHPDRVIAQVFTNSNSALADSDWAARVMPIMEAQAHQLEREGRAALDKHPFAPTRSRRLPPEAREALIADYELHNPLGIARTAVHTIPYSSVRDRVAETKVPTLLVAGDREDGFRDQARFAEQTIPGISVVHLNTGHAVNIEDATGFNTAVAEFVEPFRLNVAQSNVSTVRATSPSFIARNASFTSSSLPLRVIISSSFNRPCR